MVDHSELTPRPSFQELCDTYKAAQKAWQKRCEVDDSGGGPEWIAYEDADIAFIQFPCRTLEDVQAKANFILAEDMLYDSISNCTLGDRDLLVVFLQSLTGGGNV